MYRYRMTEICQKYSSNDVKEHNITEEQSPQWKCRYQVRAKIDVFTEEIERESENREVLNVSTPSIRIKFCVFRKIFTIEILAGDATKHTSKQSRIKNIYRREKNKIVNEE